MFRFLRLIGQKALESLQTLGRASTLWVLALWGLPRAGDVPLALKQFYNCLLYTSPSPRDRQKSRMPSSA